MKLGGGGLIVVVMVVLLTIILGSPSKAGDAPDGLRWWSHVAVLADDKLEGRNTGSVGHRKAAQYVAGQLAHLGLKPAGTDGYFQSVPLKSREIDENQSSLALIRETGREVLTLGRDAIISMRIDPAPVVEAEIVFAGYGLSIPEAKHDDFAGLDVRGKLVAYLSGAPTTIPGPLAAHMQSSAERAALLKRHGAIGIVNIMNPKNMDIPWDRLALARFLPAMSLAEPAMDETRGLQLLVTINPDHADKILAGSGHTFREIVDAAQANKPLPRFAIPAKLKATAAVRRGDVVSQNVAAMLPGNDAKLKGEFVVFTAHLDHLGIGKPINGDAIYNGAMDNASGIAAMLDVAALLKESGTKLRRSVLFVAVTAEEKGLLGSRYFANSPPVDRSAIVANINTDMFFPLFPLKKLTIYGLAESDLGDDAVAVARSLGVAPQPDPEPKRNVFIRSDQYSFIRRGIPSLTFKIGWDKGSPQEKIALEWLHDRYHAPSDDLEQPFDKQAAGLFDVLIAKLLERIANREQRPRWRETSFFKRFAVLADDDKLTERAELDSGKQAVVGRDVWYGFSVLVPPGFPVVDNRLVIAQWKQTGVSGTPLVAQRYRSGQHDITIRMPDSTFGLSKHYSLPKIEFGRWNDMVYHLRFSTDDDGVVEVWMNGKQVITYKCMTAFSRGEELIYNKIGLYRDRWKEPMTIFFDDYSLGESFAAVDPSHNTHPTR